MNHRILRNRDELIALASEWNPLLRASGADSVFLTWEWIRTWLDVLPEVRLLVVAVRDDDGKLCGLAPFFMRSLALGGVLSFESLQMLGGAEAGSDYPDLIVREPANPAVIEAIADALNECGREWDCLWLPAVAGWTGARERLRALFQAGGWFVNEREAEFACVDLPATHEELRDAQPEKMRKHLRQYIRRHAIDGPWRFVDLTAEGRIEEGLNALFDLHSQRWQLRGDSGAFGEKTGMTEFCRRFAAAAHQSAWLRLYGLSDGVRLGAVQFGYVYRDEFLAVQEGFDPAVQPPGIGHVLRDESMRRCIEAGLRRYDFLGEFTDHKRRWGARRRVGSDFLAGRRRLKNRLLFTHPIWPTGRFLHEAPLQPARAKTSG
ncbi:MAG: GNAT family N-acetyltransferase [Planctomycetes bacterium]|nr:GNAT family N-acetyltransferase [Planctomycetota bacterium]